MNSIGVDLHKKTISVCVMIQEGRRRTIVARQSLRCANETAIAAWFAAWQPFEVVVEATANYEWFLKLIEPTASRIVLAHPKKLRVIAESTRKTDKLDAQLLAEFLTLDMIPQAYRPTPRQREYRQLVRHRYYLRRRITSVKNKLHHLAGHYNADLPGLFTQKGQEHLRRLPLSSSDRFIAEQLEAELKEHLGRCGQIDRQLAHFAQKAALVEREARAVLESMPGMGAVTIDVLLSELGDVRRFRSQKHVMAYAGLVPGLRQSAERCRSLGITKEGSRLLRWAMIQLAWRMINKTRRWGLIYQKLQARCGPKKAVVAVARRLLGVIVALLRSGQQYRLAAPCV